MIEVRFQMFKSGSFRFTCKGHAGAGEKGRDPVCAGASALAYGLAVNLKHSENMLDEGKIEEKDGLMKITFKPKPEYMTSLSLLFAAKKNEFIALERGHEQYIKVW